MTVTSTNQKVSFSGNGSTTVFAYNFKIFAQTDLLVILRSAAGTETTQTLTTHYTVSGVGVTSGGNVTMGTAPASGTTLVIQRVQPQLQGLDLVPNDPFPAQSIEDALDKLVFNVQTLNEEVGRSIKASTTNVIADSEFTVSATDRANKLFSFDSSGNLSIAQELGTYKGNWAASTTYAVRDLVKDTSTGNIFICITAHTSSGSQPLTTNTDSAKWALIVDAASATTSATAAASSATAAASSATASASSATTSGNSATAAASSATAAASSATAAGSSATAAASSATSAASSLSTFQSQYHGAASSDPSSNLSTGDLYFNTSSNTMKVYNGSAWVAAAFDTSGALINTNNLSDVSSAATALTNLGVTSTAAELNQLDAITRGSILYGNASGATARLAKGAADTVLTSDGTDVSWVAADTGATFAGATVTVTGDVTLTTGQNGNLIRVTATNEKIITLPAAANGLFYVFSNETAYSMYIKPNGAQTINGIAGSIILAAGADGIISCGTAGTNWSSVGITRTMVIAKNTTFYNINNEDGTRLTGTYTPILDSALLVCVGSATAGSANSAGSNNYRSGGSGGQGYGEKFIASPDSSYAYEICGGGAANPNAGYDKTTTAAGITCTRGPDSAANSHNNANLPARTGGTSSGGTVNFTGGTSSAGTSSVSGAGGGAATRAGNGGNASGRYGGGTGGNNSSGSAVGAAATARDSSTYDISSSSSVSVTSETYLAGYEQSTNNNGGNGAGPKTVVNFNTVNFTIADATALYAGNESLEEGGTRGSNEGGTSGRGVGGYVTFVEFI